MMAVLSVGKPERERGATPRRVLGRPVPAEGEGGLFTQSWFPICLSRDVATGQVKGFTFLDGRVVVFRGEDSKAKVMSAYCAHLGADLAEGRVVGNAVQCAFHHWEFGADGQCERIGIGDPVPKGACIFAFPTVELYGVIWAFNGTQPLFELPAFPEQPDGIYWEAEQSQLLRNIDPWVVCAQTPDIPHVVILHNFDVLSADAAKSVVWTDHSMFYDICARVRGRIMDVRAGIIGTSVFFQTGKLDGRWFGFMVGLSIPLPGKTRSFAIFACEKSGDEAADRNFVATVRDFEFSIAAEDQALAASMHFRPGALTQGDRTLGQFFAYMRKFPRAHPSAEFIN